MQIAWGLKIKRDTKCELNKFSLLNGSHRRKAWLNNNQKLINLNTVPAKAAKNLTVMKRRRVT